MRLEPDPLDPLGAGLDAPPGGAHNPGGVLAPGEPLALTQLAPQSLELVGEQSIHRMAGQAEGGPGKCFRTVMPVFLAEGRAPCLHRARGDELRIQTQSVQDVDSAAANELATDAVPWIAPRFVEGHRNVALSQGNAQREARQTPADNRDGMRSGHMRWARKRWLNKPARCSRKRHLESAGHKAESSPP